jgi:hypothetical protein
VAEHTPYQRNVKIIIGTSYRKDLRFLDYQGGIIGKSGFCFGADVRIIAKKRIRARLETYCCFAPEEAGSY